MNVRDHRALQREHAMSVVQRAPGVSGAAAMWLSLGGRFDSARKPCGSVQVEFGDLLRAYKLPVRIGELVKDGKLKRGKGLYQTQGAGFYPVGVSVTQAAKAADMQMRRDSMQHYGQQRSICPAELLEEMHDALSQG